MRTNRSIIVTVAAFLLSTGVASAQATLTSQQADDIFEELRAIRQQPAPLKLDMKQFDACTKSTEYDPAITKDMTEGPASR